MKRRIAYVGLLLLTAGVAYGRPEVYNAENAGLVLDYGGSLTNGAALCVGIEVKGQPGFFGPTNEC